MLDELCWHLNRPFWPDDGTPFRVTLPTLFVIRFGAAISINAHLWQTPHTQYIY